MSEITKESLLKRRERLAHDIEQIFIDAEHWNECVRSSSEDPIDPARLQRRVVRRVPDEA